MAVYWTYAPAVVGLWNTADVPLGSIPTPRTQITEQEWKDALALQNGGYELVDGAGHKPVGQMPAPDIAAQRAGMVASRLYFHDACRATALGGGTVYSALLTQLAAMTATEQARYADMQAFRRLKPEIVTYFQHVGGVNLTDAELDTLFLAAMALEAA